jgi:hypothetical protein
MLAASTAYAQPSEKPTLWIQEFTTDLCHERPYGASLALFSCQGVFGIDLFSVSERASDQDLSGSFLPSREAPSRKIAAVTKFSLLAGKFMGRVDAATMGQWRLRFVVILK